MKKTKWLAACMAACALALVAGCSNDGGPDLSGVVDTDEPELPGVVDTDEPELPGIEYDAEKWDISGTTVVRYTGAEADVRVPDGVESIGNYAFYGCIGLASVEIPDSVTSIGNYAFSHCNKLASVTIPGSVKSIGGGVFEKCESLASVEIGDGVTSIGNYAFSGCTILASVTIPDSVTSIGYQAFWCNSLKEVNYGGTAAQWKKIDIDSRAFYDINKLTITDKNGEEITYP